MQTEPYNAATHPPTRQKIISVRYSKGTNDNKEVWSSKAGNAEEEKQKEVLLPPKPPLPTGWFIPNDDGSDDCH